MGLPTDKSGDTIIVSGLRVIVKGLIPQLAPRITRGIFITTFSAYKPSEILIVSPILAENSTLLIVCLGPIPGPELIGSDPSFNKSSPVLTFTYHWAALAVLKKRSAKRIENSFIFMTIN